jgi:hypothetical protein
MKTLVIATILSFAPAFAFAMGCHGSEERTTAASCPVGQAWDAATSSCVVQTSS